MLINCLLVLCCFNDNNSTTKTKVEISFTQLLLVLPCLVSLAIAVPVEILSYSAAEEKHDHKMEGVPGEAVMGEFSFQVKSYKLVNCPALQPRRHRTLAMLSTS